MSPSKDTYVNVIGVDKGTSKMLKKLQSDAELAGTGVGNAIDKGSTRAGNALSKLGQTASNFGLPFAASISVIGDRFAETSTKGQKFKSVISEIGKVSLAAGALGLVAFGGQAVKLGNELEDSQASLSAAIKASGSSLDRWHSQIGAAQTSLEKLGFSNNQVDSALAHSVISTQNVGKSLSIMSLSADLARAKHIDLTTATDALDKALTGNLRPLKQMAIDLPVVASSAEKLKVANDNVATAQATVNAILAKVPEAANSASAAHGVYETAVNKLTTAQIKLNEQQSTSKDIQDALTQRLGGQAAAAAETFQGKINTLKAEAVDLGAKIGEFLIPKIEALAGFLSKNKGLVEGLAITISAVLGAAAAVFVGETVVKFVKGIGSIVSSIEAMVLKFTAARAAIITGDAAEVVANEAVGASFTAMLGPIGAVTLAIAGAFAIYKEYKSLLDSHDLGGPSSGLVSAQTAAKSIANRQSGKTGFPALSSSQLAAQIKADNASFAQQGLSARLNAQGKVVAGSDSLSSQISGDAAALQKLEDQARQDAAAQAGDGAATSANAAAHSAASKAAAAHAKALAAAKAAAKLLQEQTDKLTTSIKTMVDGALSKAKGSLKSAEDAFNSFAASVSGSIASSSLFADAEASGAATGQTFLLSLADQAGQANDFSTKVMQLLNEGLSKDALQQVLAAGTVAGDDIATQLLNGGAAAINSANAMTAAVHNSATALGTVAADEFYQSGVKQAQSIVDGITEESARLKPKLKAASKKIAENLKTQVEVDLRIISQGGKIPKLASGGYVPASPGGTLAILGEGGRGETVVPDGSSLGGGNHFYGDIIVPGVQTPQDLVNGLRTWTQRNGSLANAGIK